MSAVGAHPGSTPKSGEAAASRPPTAPAPADVPQRSRIEMTVSCRDCDQLPKVPGAGSVRDGVQLMHNGVRVVAGGYYGAWMAEIIERLRGHHEPQEELVFHHLLERIAADPPEVPVIVELGAFWSYYSLWFLHRLPSGRAVLLEPDPNYLDVGRRNLALNGFAERALSLAGAIGSVPRPAAPFICESDGQVRPVPVESVPSVLAAAGLDRIDVLLVDVQGAELAALEGARAMLSEGRIRFVVVSTHHHLICGDPLMHQRCLQLLREAGGHVVAEHSVAESFSGDGLVVVSFDERDQELLVEVSRARAVDSLFGDPVVDLARAQELIAAQQRELEQHRSAASTVGPLDPPPQDCPVPPVSPTTRRPNRLSIGLRRLRSLMER